MRAIKTIGGDLKVALDPNSSVGVIDSYFPEAHYFSEFERFDRHIDKLRRQGDGVDYISICSPNYLHDAHVRFALRSDCDVICEKPLVLNPWNLDALSEIEESTGRMIRTILQLRHHPSIKALKERIDGSNHRHRVELTYITSRGRWYHSSWKGEDAKSGGIATNIGIHFFDMLACVFGPAISSVAHLRTPVRAAGFLECDKADVSWFLSINSADLPESVTAQKKSAYRSMTLDGEEIEFSEGFTDLHTRSYEEIVDGRGFGLNEARPSIEMTAALRNAKIDLAAGERHSMVAGLT
jgi:UDP-N-acetyl-2-amino-2-deoxyglucuronate dehydrogenase